MMLALLLSAATALAQDFRGRTEMNQIAFKSFAGFSERWELVTVRYRTDSQEMRFVYANPRAAEALRRGVREFPDGAVFGKVGRAAEHDPAFTSSLVPSGSKRFQFMVRDRRKYADTAGWGYALFDGDGKTFGDEPKAAAQACAACHSLVEGRGHVFSSFLESPLAVKQGPLEFQMQAAKDLPPEVREWLREADASVDLLKGRVTESVFPGTLDEIVPSLTEKALGTGRPALLLSRDRKRFSLVIWDRLNKVCGTGDQVAMMSLRGGPEYPSRFSKKSFCASKPK